MTMSMPHIRGTRLDVFAFPPSQESIVPSVLYLRGHVDQVRNHSALRCDYFIYRQASPSGRSHVQSQHFYRLLKAIARLCVQYVKLTYSLLHLVKSTH